MPVKYPKGVYGLFIRGWNEVPEIVASSGMALIGIGLAFVGGTIYYQKDGDNRRNKLEYTVIRHDDPLAAKAK